MKVYPRVHEISNGNVTFFFKIKNSSNTDKILLFKIRRPEPRLVTFFPKQGIVESGNTQTIQAQLVSTDITKAKILIKMVVIKRSELGRDFEVCWEAGVKRGMVKKVIEFRSSTAQATSVSPTSTMPPISSNQSSPSLDFDCLSIASSYNNDYELEDQFAGGAQGRAVANSPYSSASFFVESGEDFDDNKHHTHSYPTPPSFAPVPTVRSVTDILASSGDFGRSGDSFDIPLSPETVPMKGDQKIHSSNRASPTMSVSELLARNTPAQLVPDSDDDSILESPYVNVQAEAIANPQSVSNSLSISATTPNVSDILSQAPQRASSPHFMSNTTTNLNNSGNLLNINDTVRLLLQSVDGSQATESTGAPPSPNNSLVMLGVGLGLGLQGLNVPPAQAQPAGDSHSQTCSKKDIASHVFPVVENDAASFVSKASGDVFSDKKQGPRVDAVQVGLLEKVSTLRTAVNTSTAVLEITGQEATDSVVKDAIEMQGSRIFELQSKKNKYKNAPSKIAAIEITHCPLQTIEFSIGSVFTSGDPRSFANDENHTDNVSILSGSDNSDESEELSAQAKLNSLQAMVLNESVRHIIINHTQLKLLESNSIYRYQQLQFLDLSHNNIQQISGGLLELPYLEQLDISDNLFRSLDFLQELYSLKVLDASSNKLGSLKSSVYMLLPLANSLQNLNLSLNPVSVHQRYIDEVLEMIPALDILDGHPLGKQRSNTNASSGKYASHPRHGAPSSVPPLPAANTTANSTLPPTDEETELRIKRALNRIDFQIQKKNGSGGGLNTSQTSQPSYSPNSSFSAGSIGNTSTSNTYNTPYVSKPVAKKTKSIAEELMDGAPEGWQSSVPSPAAAHRKGAHQSLAVTRSNPSPSPSIHSTHAPITRTATKVAPVQGASASLMRLTGCLTSRRQSFGIPTSTGEAIQHHIEDSFVHQQEEKQHDKVEEQLRKSQQAPGTPGSFNSGGPQFMKGTKSTRSRRASFDMHCLDNPGAVSEQVGSLSATKYIHKSYLSEFNSADPNLSPIKAAGSQTPSFDPNSSLMNSVHNRGVSGGHVYSVCNTSGNYENAIAATGQRLNMSRSIASKTVAAARQREMDEDPRYSIWHQRYRVPVPVFGFSKPFIHRDPNKKRQRKYPPLYEKNVVRIRNGFEKVPNRGTFTRASKGLPSLWYPADSLDLEAVRRRGYFHETIGDIQKGSYRDLEATSKQQRSSDDIGLRSVAGESLLDKSGSQVLAPQKSGRRSSVGQHQSRQYLSDTSRTEEHRYRTVEDQFSGFRKWRSDSIALQPNHSVFDNSSQSGGRYNDDQDDWSNNYNMPQDKNVNSMPEDYQRNDAGASSVSAGDSHISDNVDQKVPFAANDGTSVELHPDGERPRPDSYMNKLFGLMKLEDGEESENENAQDESGYFSDPGPGLARRSFDNAPKSSDKSDNYMNRSSFDSFQKPPIPSTSPVNTPGGGGGSLHTLGVANLGVADPAPEPAHAESNALVNEQEVQLAAYMDWLEKQNGSTTGII